MSLAQAIYIFVILICSSIAAQAAGERDLIIQNDMDNAEKQIHEKSEWDLTLSTEASTIKYVEHVLGTTFIKELGSMYGINAVLTYHPAVGNALNTEISDVYRLEAMFTYGKMDYRGAIQYSDGSSSPESFDGISDYMVEIRDLVGKDFNFNRQSTRLTPYIGAGYRSLFDASFANKPFGYDRRIQYIYAPIGAEIMTKLNDGWSIGADAEYDIFVRGFVTSYLGEIGLGDITNTQKGGYGLRGSVKLVKNSDHFNLFIEPYVRFWDIHASRWDSSTPFNGYFFIAEEPANTSFEIGGKLGIEF